MVGIFGKEMTTAGRPQTCQSGHHYGQQGALEPEVAAILAVLRVIVAWIFKLRRGVILC